MRPQNPAYHPIKSTQVEAERIRAHTHFPIVANWNDDGGAPVDPRAINMAALFGDHVSTVTGLDIQLGMTRTGAVNMTAIEPMVTNLFTIWFSTAADPYVTYVIENPSIDQRCHRTVKLTMTGDLFALPEEGLAPIDLWDEIAQLLFVDPAFVEQAHDLSGQSEPMAKVRLSPHIIERIHRIAEKIERETARPDPATAPERNPLWGSVIRLASDYEPWGEISNDQRGADCSCGCRHFVELSAPYSLDWGVCTNPKSPRAGLLTFEHQNGLSCFEPEPGEWD